MTDSELVTLVLDEARAAAKVCKASAEYDAAPTGNIAASPIGPLHEAWMHARAVLRQAVLARLEAETAGHELTRQALAQWRNRRTGATA